MLFLVFVAPAAGRWCYSYVATKGLPFWRWKLKEMDSELGNLVSDRNRKKSEKEEEKKALERWLQILENRWRIEIANRTKEMEARREEVKWAMERSKADFEQDEDKLKYEIQELQKEKDRLEDAIEKKKREMSEFGEACQERLEQLQAKLDEEDNKRKAERLKLEKRADSFESQVIKTQIRNRDLKKNMTRVQTVKKCKKRGCK